MNPCKKCGACCQVIFLDCTQGRIKKIAYQGNGVAKRDAQFIRKYWKAISRREAFQLNPNIKKLSKKSKVITFYTCTLLDKNNQCKFYHKRPQVCKDYPFYRDEPSLFNEERLQLGCGYKEYIQKEKAKKIEKETGLIKVQ